MAKSIRSKRRRKMRAIKRVRYGQKELERLQKTLANDTITAKKETDEVMTDISEIATVTDVKKIKEKKKQETSEENDVERMDDGSKKPAFNKRTMKNQHGSYPVWMHQRKIKQRVKASKKKAKMNKKKK